MVGGKRKGERKKTYAGEGWRRLKQAYFCQEVCDQILYFIGLGNYPETAAKAVGIGATTWHKWVARARKASQQSPCPPEELPYLAFWRELERALAIAEQNNLEVIRKAGEKDWKAAAWLQSRRYADRWGDKRTVEHTGQVEHSHQHSATYDVRELLAGMTIEEKKRLLSNLRAKKEEDRALPAPRECIDAEVIPPED